MEISQCLKQLEKEEVVSTTRNHWLQFQRKVSWNHCVPFVGFCLLAKAAESIPKKYLM